jgi:excisionase family DNA binding protein
MHEYIPNQNRPPKLALRKAEAADSLGVSVDHFERHVLPDLRVVRSGRLVLIPEEELRKWLSRNAAKTLG